MRTFPTLSASMAAGAIAGIVLAALGLPGILSGQSSAAARQQTQALERPFSPTSFWNTQLAPAAQLDANSAALAADLATQERTWGAWINTTSYSTPVYVVPANQGTVRVQI